MQQEDAHGAGGESVTSHRLWYYLIMATTLCKKTYRRLVSDGVHNLLHDEFVDAVERIQVDHGERAVPIEFWDELDKLRDAFDAAIGEYVDPITDEQLFELVEYMYTNHGFVEAIKMYRKHTQGGLIECRNTVLNLAATNGWV